MQTAAKQKKNIKKEQTNLTASRQAQQQQVRAKLSTQLMQDQINTEQNK